MKKLTYILMVIALVVGVTNDLQAQERGERGNRGDRQGQGQDRQQMSFSERQGRMLKVLSDSLELNAEQIKGIKKINTSYDEKFEKLREEVSEGGDRSQMREKMRPLMEKYNAEVKALLTEKQKLKFDELSNQRRSNRPSRDGQEGSSRRSRGSNRN